MTKLRYLWLLALIMLLAAGGNDTSKIAYEDLPATGDAQRGAELFTSQIDLAPPCSGCHLLDGTQSGSPDLTSYAAVAGERVEGESAREYTFWAITEPGRFIVDGFGNAMYNQYDEKMTPQDIADLIEYLLSS
jgi:mono/diheme cytochrome c family protein